MIKATIEGLTDEEEVLLADALGKLNDFFKNNYLEKNEDKKE